MRKGQAWTERSERRNGETGRRVTALIVVTVSPLPCQVFDCQTLLLGVQSERIEEVGSGYASVSLRRVGELFLPWSAGPSRSPP